MKRLLGLIAALAMLQVAAPAWADGPVAAKTVSACGTPGSTPVAGNPQPLTIDTTGVLCTSSTGGGGGGNTSTTATAVAPTLTEGSTNNALSVNLKGENRSIISNGGVTATVTAGNALKVDNSAVTQPISAASLPLPTGASTAAKQPALGTAGTASSDVLTVQGIASMTALKVDGSAVTQPISGTVTASNTTGNVASGSADSGNPVKVGAKYNATRPTFSDGNRGDLQIGSRGSLAVQIMSPDSPSQVGANSPADGLGGPTSLAVLPFTQTFNGTNWDRLRSAANGQDTTGTGITAVGAQAQFDDVGTSTVTENQFANLRIDSSRQLRVVDGSATATYTGGAYDGTNNKNQSGFQQAIADAAISTAASAVKPQAQTTGGCTAYGYQSAASTNSTLVSTGQHTLCSLTVINTTATLYYLRLYNSSGAPTCSSATGFVLTVPAPASTTGAGAALPLGPFGVDFSTGLAFCLTGGGSSTDNTNAATGVYVIAAYK